MRKAFRSDRNHLFALQSIVIPRVRCRSHQGLFNGRVINLTLSMNTQETALPQRVVRSAKNLASATLSGTFELNDLQSRKQVGTSTQALHDYGKHSSDITRFKSIPESRKSSFRDEWNATACKEAEEDFERFQASKDFRVWQNHEFVEGSEALRGASVLQGSAYGSQDVPRTPYDAIYSTIANGHAISTSVPEKPSSKIGSATGPVDDAQLYLARTAALRRLRQIGAHLQKNLAMQVLQQVAFEQSHASMHRASAHAQNQQPRQHIDENPEPIRSDKVRSDRNNNQGSPSSEQSHESVSRGKEPSALSLGKEEDGLQRQFHCPYYACHRNLQLLPLSGSSSSQRRCVHVGCTFQANTLNSWDEHIHVPHHDLLGSY
jgi:hypothetical protein